MVLEKVTNKYLLQDILLIVVFLGTILYYEHTHTHKEKEVVVLLTVDSGRTVELC